MRPLDRMTLAFSALGRHKVRTALTLLGVTIGTFTLVASLSVGRGVDRAIVDLFRETDALRKVEVRNRYEQQPSSRPPDVVGAMSEAKRERLRKAIDQRGSGGPPNEVRSQLDPAALERLRGLPHVVAVEPVIQTTGDVQLIEGQGSTATESAQVVTAIERARGYRDRIVAGRDFEPGLGRVALVHEYLLYRWGITGDDVSSVLGRTIRLSIPRRREGSPGLAGMLKLIVPTLSDDEAHALPAVMARLSRLVRVLPLPLSGVEREALRKLMESGTRPPDVEKGVPAVGEFRIIGVLREWSESDDRPGHLGAWSVQTADVLLPAAAAAELYLESEVGHRDGFEQVVLALESEEYVKAATESIEKMGYHAGSLGPIIESVRLNVLLITFATSFVAVVALTVAALGITNTMVMSVLERTREIGVMKALGARDGHILSIFLVEGAVLGLVGGLAGLGLGWLASIPGDAIARSIMEPQTNQPVKGPIFVFPTWLVLGAPAVACLVTTLAALYPARRAAKVDPVTSLRHE